MKMRKRETNKSNNDNFGKQLDEVIRFKEKSKVNVRKSANDYIDEAERLAVYVMKRLEKNINKLSDTNITNAETLKVADEIYQVLVETNITKLEKCKEEYDFWDDWNNKFNS